MSFYTKEAVQILDPICGYKKTMVLFKSNSFKSPVIVSVLKQF